MHRLATNRTEKTNWRNYINLFRHRQTPFGMDAGCYLRIPARSGAWWVDWKWRTGKRKTRFI